MAADGQNIEKIETTLHWVGDWPWWIGLPAALLLGYGAFCYYRRDVRALAWWQRISLPLCRGLAVAMIVVMLSGPVLHHRKTIGKLARLWLFADGSQSMLLTDSGMETGRKVLILQRLNLLPPNTVKTDLPKAGEALAELQATAARVQGQTSIDVAAWRKTVDECSAHVDEVRGLLSGTIETERLERLKRDLAEPLREFGRRSTQAGADQAQLRRDLAQVGEAARRWQQELRGLFDTAIAPQLADARSPLRDGLAKFDRLPRWQRLQTLLLEAGQKKLLAQMAASYEVQLQVLSGHEVQPLWEPTARNSDLPSALPSPTGDLTDLAALKSGLSPLAGDQRAAVVLFSDGQHTDGESPLEMAGVLGARGIPIFAIGMGNQNRPRDLAVLKVQGPASVFHEDRYRGEITLKDDVPVGQGFTVLIRDGDKVVWEQKFLSENRTPRRIPFEIDIKPIAEAHLQQAARASGGAEVNGLAIELKAAVTPAEGETELGNNERTFRFRAVTQKRRILIVDGRPRWETRYLRNMFERDEQWEVTSVVAGSKTGSADFERGEGSEQFPAEASKLQTYDLIFFGEVPRGLWKDDELTRIRSFVEKRGGAAIFIDGARGAFAQYVETPLGAMLPVEFKASPVLHGIKRLVLTDRAANLAAFALAPDRTANSEIWGKLQPPRWISGATPLPGAETLLEAEVNGERVPVAVSRPFGAGQVYYHAFDDSWRWRYEVADQWHVRFWNQLANYVAEPAFAVRDKFVSLDAGPITYQPGEAAELRVRLRDGEGKPVSDATVEAALTRDGRRAGTIRLSPGEGGLYRGHTGPLEPGEYQVAVETAAIPETELKARTDFKVEPRDTNELSRLEVNEDLLRQVAAASGGRYFREENFDRVLEMIAPMTQGHVVESDTVLWQSWWWFLPIVGLLTLEWLLRKRAGML